MNSSYCLVRYVKGTIIPFYFVKSVRGYHTVTSDFAKAYKFDTRADAEEFLEHMINPDDFKIEEHAWMEVE